MDADNYLHIDVFSDYVCPWCYLSTAALRQLQENYPLKIHWRPFPLHPDTPQQGLSLDALFGGRNMDAIHQQLRERMEEAGLDYCERSHTFNTRLAQELALWAETQAGGEAIHQALFHAYFAQHRNLAETEVLLDAVKEAGLDQAAAETVLQERSYREALDKAWENARQHQISAVPSFVAGGYIITGCQPYGELEKFVNYVMAREAMA